MKIMNKNPTLRLHLNPIIWNLSEIHDENNRKLKTPVLFRVGDPLWLWESQQDYSTVNRNVYS